MSTFRALITRWHDGSPTEVEYRYWFSYERFKNGKRKGQPQVTIFRLEAKEVGVDKEFVFICGGQAKCSKHDAYDKFKGRILAAQRGLATIRPEVKAAFWESYKATHKMQSWSKLK